MPQDAFDHPFYKHHGQTITALEAFELIEKGGSLTDDTSKQRLTIIAQKDIADRIKNDLQTSPELLAFRNKLLVNSYPPGHWAVSGVGLVRTEWFTLPFRGGSGGVTPLDCLWFRKRPVAPLAPPLVPKVPATIILQSAPDAKGRGRVLHMQLDYNDGPHGLAKAIRKADSSYDPKKDNDLPKDNCPNCPDDQPANDSGISCPVYWTLISVVVLVARMLVPDIVFGIGWAAGKAMSSLKSHASQELAALKAELATLKQNKPAA
jgi:hypothetical protein